MPNDLPTDKARRALENQVADIIRRHVWGRVNGGAAELLGFHAAAAEVLASLRGKTAGGAGERDRIASAKMIPWEPGSAGGVHITYESGYQVAIPLDPSPQGEGGQP